ncbi:lipopolysaccharide transport periplasmic protein LptA [Marinobacter orientalis]|uniref:Lipopolysaccharide export system protein LptA n=1 Tax=Marinobacter orientalis TaxID=1928859 RepID=A0A7Y0RFA8_9GAMM|nr:lipopolysaccharide transport periplasmic protein LptA [Marinobacter orientalis]NMT65179.1 lipopolysaccharide transport periplasmic protein LptA [Marinobacter orientalis]TGX48049.1 lipopolysaccharide transport periplasmic protein LptA [Marinobacter orientalis]
MSPANKFLQRVRPFGPAAKPVVVAAVCLALFAPASQAFDPQSDAPIRVSADSARLDDVRGIATYTGAVEMTQGQTSLSADKVVLYRDETGISRIEANGQPAHYRQPATEGQGKTDARALDITWSASENRVTFEREAVIEQDGNLFRGDIIHYDSADRIVTAKGAADEGEGSGRVEMVIQPRGTTSNPDRQDTDGSSQSQ